MLSYKSLDSGNRSLVEEGAQRLPAVMTPHGAAPQGHVHLILPNLLDTLRSLMSFIVVALFVLTFVVQPFRIPSESMERTLLVGDFLLVNKAVFGPPGHWGWLLPYRTIHRDDIIVFRFPLDPSDHLVKRVVALPGDSLQMRGRLVFVNGQRQNEPFATFEGSDQDAFRDQFPSTLSLEPDVDPHWWMEMQSQTSVGELRVPANSYFVLGDNRNHSRDSRYWGFVSRARIVGRPFLIYFSLREPSATDTAMLPDDRLGHEKDILQTIVNFARWNRIFRIVR